MKVYKGIDEFEKIANAVVTTGTFDGVHLGHLQILNKLKEEAVLFGGETVILTFFPHPRMVLFPDDNDLKLLNTLAEKIKLLEAQGIQHLIIQPFSKEFSRLSSIDFVRTVLVDKIGTKKLVIGHDHRFGRNREGAFEHLLEFGPMYGFEVIEIPAHLISDTTISSTKIRNAVLAGNIERANEFLGYKYFITGTVVEGQKIGREIGFPTANIKVEETYKLLPANGVYAITAKVKNEAFYGMMNIGFKPTFGNHKLALEVHLFNFNSDIYKEKIEVHFEKRIRDEKKFASVDDLINQLNTDADNVKALFQI